MSCWTVAARRMNRCGPTSRDSAKPSQPEPAGWKQRDLMLLFPMLRNSRVIPPETGAS